ncbi:MAG TPA: hypothetical protein VGI81_03660, partial [Tepidisphaeraceae bacterium]
APSEGGADASGNTVQNALISQIDYAPFFVPVPAVGEPNPQAAAYQSALTQAAPTKLSETDYYYLGNDGGSPANIGLQQDQIQFLDGDAFRTTSYGGYVDGKPSTVIVSVTRNGVTQQVSKTDNYYVGGNLKYTFDALGQGTEYDYSGDPDDTSGLPKGLLLSTWAVRDEQNPAPLSTQPLTQNTYYTSSGGGAAYGRLQSSTDASGQLTYYTYDAVGNLVNQYKLWLAPPGQSNLWVGTTTTYDTSGRPQWTYQAEYLDGGTPKVLDVNASGTITEPAYGGFNGGNPLQTGYTNYDGQGRVNYTVDQYGQQTTTTYDANGNAIKTENPDGTVVQSVYDPMGRVIWQTDPYVLNGPQPLMATHTVYDSQGRVIETDRYQGTNISLTDDPIPTNQVKDGDWGTPISSSYTFYDGQGRVVETDTAVSPGADPSTGTRTGTIYYPDGQVQYTGPLKPNAPITTTAAFLMPAVGDTVEVKVAATSSFAVGQALDISGAGGFVVVSITDGTKMVVRNTGTDLLTGQPNTSSTGEEGHQVLVGGTTAELDPADFASYTQYLYDQINTGTGLPYSGMVYDRVIDPNGHWTDTYQDQLGRTTFTVYGDGSFTQTLYSVNGQAVTALPGGITPPDGLLIPAGGSETVSIAQRQATDAPVATYDVYDAAGNLLDVYQPPVADMDPNSPTYYPTYHQFVAPLWQYTYDQGNETSQTDPKGNITKWTYDERGNKLTHTLPGLESESWTYDQYNRVVTHVDFNGDTAWEVYANTPQLFGTYGPDPGRLLAEYRYNGSFSPPDVSQQERPYQTPWAERTVYVYDDGTTDPSVSYSMPSGEGLGLGRVVEVQEWTTVGGTALTDFTHTTYDAVTGQPDSITSAEGVIHYAYDPVTGRKVRMWTQSVTGTPTVSDDTAYAYDSQGRLSDVYTLMLDQTPYATFDAIDPITHNPTFTGGTPLDVHYTYDLAGNLKTESQPDQTTTTYGYDDENRLTDLSTENTASNEPVFAEHYDLYNNGLRQHLTDTRYNADGTLFSQTKTTWLYDSDGRLTSESLTILDDGSGETTNANGHAPAAYTDVFQFDLDGNRAEEDISGSQNATITYTYNGNNELLTDTRTGDGAYQILYGHYDANNVFQPGYDAAGNLTEQHRFVNGTDVEDDSYTWDLRGRMATATVGGVQTAYTYDTDGVRTSETTGTASTYYLNDPNNPTGYTKAVEESATRGGAPDRAFLIGLQVEGQADGTNGVLFLMHDGHGNTRALLNVSGGIVEQYNFDAYGDLLASTGAQSNVSLALTPWLQPDGLYDPASGWNYNLARWRDGFRFASMDPTSIDPGEVADANLYVYVANDPLNAIDPSGNLFSNLIFGNEVHRLIGADFTSRTPGGLSDKSFSFILKPIKVRFVGRFRPDLVSPRTGEVYQIKPEGSFLDGSLVLTRDVAILRGFDSGHVPAWHRGSTYLPPRVLHLGPLTIALVEPPVAGVILYEVIDFREILVASALVYAARTLYGIESTAVSTLLGAGI